MFKKKTRLSAAAVVVAAGTSSRMGGINKQLLMLDGMPVLARTLMAFERVERIEKIVVVTKSDLILTVSDMVREFGISKVCEIVPGGATRQKSVMEGLKQISGYPLTAIHDGARPFVSEMLINKALDMAEEFGAAAPGVVPKDTIKMIDSQSVVASTPDRDTLRLIQTPQVFKTELIRSAYEYAEKNGIEGTDDCSLAELYGAKIKITDGEYTNIKITTPEDIALAETILGREEERYENRLRV